MPWSQIIVFLERLSPVPAENGLPGTRRDGRGPVSCRLRSREWLTRIRALGLGSGGEEVAAAFEVLIADETQIGFVNQGGLVEAVAGPW